MAIVNTLHYLPPQELRFELWHLSIGFHLQVTMQTATVDVFHNEKDLFWRLKSFVQFSNVRIVKFFHDFHFTFDTLLSVWLDQFDFFVNFDCDLLVQLFV